MVEGQVDGGQMNSLAAAGGEKCWRTGDEGQAGVVLQALGGSPPSPPPRCSPPSTPFSLWGAPSTWEGTFHAHYEVLSSGHHQPRQIPVTAWGGSGRCTSRGAEVTYQVVAAGDGQGEWGVATPQGVGIRSVRQEQPDYVPGTLGGEKGRRTRGWRRLPLQEFLVSTRRPGR